MTEDQKKKLESVPTRLHGLYRKALAGSRKAAIRFHCVECCGWSAADVRGCTAKGCVMYPYRLPGALAKPGEVGPSE